ncbi:MAG: TetR family transcriptional regulator [Deltaproteobacteria bacterium]|nr:TetR family transcriptional regulator [Deltaproteobacteria bacterium]
MSTPSATPRSPRGEATKRAILDAAMSLYAKRGYQGTGLIAIGESAGVTHAGVLYHYGSARNLLAAVLDERDRRFWRDTAEGWVGKDGLVALAQLPRVAEWNLANRELAKLYSVLQAENVDEEQEAHEYFVWRRRRVRGRIERAIDAGKKRGEIRLDVDARRKADEVVAFMDGAQLHALLDPEVDAIAIFESYTEALVRSLAVEAASTGKPKPKSQAKKTPKVQGVARATRGRPKR